LAEREDTHRTNPPIGRERRHGQNRFYMLQPMRLQSLTLMGMIDVTAAIIL